LLKLNYELESNSYICTCTDVADRQDRNMFV